MKPPVAEVKLPGKEVKPPVKAVKSPVKAVKPPVKAVKSPVKAVKSPVKAVKSPVKAVKPSVKEVKLPRKEVKPSVMILYVTGRSVGEAPFDAHSMRDVLDQEPCEGVYTVGRTYHSTQVIQWDRHFARLQDSAKELGWGCSFEPSVVRQTLRKMILSASWGDSRFRLFVAQAAPSALRVAIEPFSPLVEERFYHSGVRCVTLPGLFREHPSSKQASWTASREIAVYSLDPEIHTGLLVDENGQLLEGLDCNFYAVRDKRLWTAEQGVLVGLTLRILWEIAPSILPVVREPVSVEDIPFLEEAFLTSSSRGVLPVSAINGIPIGDGKIGSYTCRLRDAFHQWVEDHLVEL